MCVLLCGGFLLQKDLYCVRAIPYCCGYYWVMICGLPDRFCLQVPEVSRRDGQHHRGRGGGEVGRCHGSDACATHRTAADACCQVGHSTVNHQHSCCVVKI